MAASYDKEFADIALTVLPVAADVLPNRHLYPVRTPHREQLRSHLAARGVETLIHYPVPLPRQPALQRFVLPGQEFPAAEKAAGELMSLPLYPEMTEPEQQHVVDCVRDFFQRELAI